MLWDPGYLGPEGKAPEDTLGNVDFNFTLDGKRSHGSFALLGVDATGIAAAGGASQGQGLSMWLVRLSRVVRAWPRGARYGVVGILIPSTMESPRPHAIGGFVVSDCAVYFTPFAASSMTLATASGWET